MENPEKPVLAMPMRNASDLPFLILASFFVGSLVIASVLAVKILSVWIIIVPAGVIAYSITFTITDTISEIYGKQVANRTVLAGFITLMVVFSLIWVARKLPGAAFWPDGEAFEAVMGQGMRIIIASLAAYAVSQFHDVWAFHYWRRATKGKHLWLRNNLSTWASQLIDTVIFILIAFAGSRQPIFMMIWGQYLAKVIIAALDTPVTYILVHVLRPTVRTEK